MFWPKGMSLGDKLQRLALISPKDVRAIEILVDDVLRRRWRKFEPLYPRRQNGGKPPR